MVVSRDQIVLTTSRGMRQRKPGGSESFYTLPPGGEHAVNVRFSFADLPVGETVGVAFDRALLIGGNPLPEPIAPIALRIEAPPPARNTQ